MPAGDRDIDALLLERRYVGKELTRFSPVTASALRRPDLIWPTAGGSEEKFMVMTPEITSISAGPVPL